MATPRPLGPKAQTGRAPTKVLPTGNRQRHPLSGPGGLHLAGVAPGLSTLPHRVSLLPGVAEGRHLGEDSRRPSAAGAAGGWQEPPTDHGHCGQPDGEDDRAGWPAGVRRGKKVCGRKRWDRSQRHLVVDTLGLVWGLVVTPASVADWDGAREVLLGAKRAAPRLSWVFADSAYAAIVFWAVWFVGVAVLLVRKVCGQKGLVVQPKRWIVERTFGWLNRYRRLAEDQERTVESSSALVYVALIPVMVRRLTRSPRFLDRL
ncbi:MAG: hypothetical protein KatS3mg107_1301 [Gemmataceae bacterium]|nr:MAG: hypothetical protein KatS3mg107_1301 [Gemmataceae bacterium]